MSEPEAPRSRTTLVAVVVAAVFAIATVLLAVVAVGLKSDKDELAEGGAQEEVVAAASGLVEAMFVRDADIDAWRARVEPLVTGDLRDQFQDGYDDIGDASAALGFRSSTVVVSDVFTTQASGPLAQAIVIFDLETTYADGRSVSDPNQYLVLELVDVEGEWLAQSASDLLRVIRSAVEEAGPGPTIPGATTEATTPSG